VEQSKLITRLAEGAVITAGLSLSVLIGACLMASAEWSYQNFNTHPYLVVSAWSGALTVLSLSILIGLIVLNREDEEEEEEEEDVE